jgi:hypothetical protein
MKNHINKLSVLILAIVLFSTDVFAQFEITPYTGYFFGGRARGYYGEANIADGQNWGIIGDIQIYQDVYVELMYSRLVSSALFWDYRDGERQYIDLASEYFMVGGKYQFDFGRVKPFGTLLGGVSAHSPQTPGYNNKLSFALGLGGGLKIMITDFLGIMGQGRLLLPLYVSGVGLGCGIGTGGAGCGGGVGLSSTVIQGDFNAGIVLVFGSRPGTTTF